MADYSPLSTTHLKRLRLAHKHITGGKYAQAYPLIKQLADDAVKREQWERAANLYFWAGRVRVEMENIQEAASLIHHALQMLIEEGQVNQVCVRLPQLIQAMRKNKYYEEAVILRAEALTLLPNTSGRPSSSILCPSCRSTLYADELDSKSAVCMYCGFEI